MMRAAFPATAVYAAPPRVVRRVARQHHGAGRDSGSITGLF
jgi:hypothetical protein